MDLITRGLMYEILVFPPHPTPPLTPSRNGILLGSLSVKKFLTYFPSFFQSSLLLKLNVHLPIYQQGPRGCPGKKFSQVEFVAAIATLFRDHRIEILREGGESKEEAERRVQEVVDDSAMVLLLQILRPESVGLKWVRR
jgi:hypothetical protein